MDALQPYPLCRKGLCVGRSRESSGGSQAPRACHCEIWKSGMATLSFSFSVRKMGTNHHVQG